MRRHGLRASPAGNLALLEQECRATVSLSLAAFRQLQINKYRRAELKRMQTRIYTAQAHCHMLEAVSNLLETSEYFKLLKCETLFQAYALREACLTADPNLPHVNTACVLNGTAVLP